MPYTGFPVPNAVQISSLHLGQSAHMPKELHTTFPHSSQVALGDSKGLAVA